MDTDKIIRDLSNYMDESRFFSAWEELGKKGFLNSCSIFTKFLVEIVNDFYKKFHEYSDRDHRYPLYYMTIDVTTVYITFERKDQVTFSKHDWLVAIEEGEPILYEGFKGTMSVYVKPLKCYINYDVTFDNDRRCFVEEQTRVEVTGNDFFSAFVPKSYTFQVDDFTLTCNNWYNIFQKINSNTYEEYKSKLI